MSETFKNTSSDFSMPEVDQHIIETQANTGAFDVITALEKVGQMMERLPVGLNEAQHRTERIIERQLANSYKSLNTMVYFLNQNRRHSDQIIPIEAETFEFEYDNWLTDEKMAYLSQELEADPDLKYTLVATPNIIVGTKSLIAYATEFSKNLPYEPIIGRPYFREYTDVELSGTHPSNHHRVQFSLIPSKYSEEVSGTVKEQRAKLHTLQAKHGFLKVPSVFDALTYWQTIYNRDHGQIAVSNETYLETDIRHFDMPRRSDFHGHRIVPSTAACHGGGSYFGASEAEASGKGRLAIA